MHYKRCHFFIRQPIFKFSRFLAAVRDDVEADLGSLSQAVIAGLLNRRNMDKHVLAAAVRLNEAVTLLPVEPLHGNSRHPARAIFSTVRIQSSMSRSSGWTMM